MKRLSIFLIILLTVLLTGCGGSNPSINYKDLFKITKDKISFATRLYGGGAYRFVNMQQGVNYTVSVRGNDGKDIYTGKARADSAGLLEVRIAVSGSVRVAIEKG